MFGCFCLIINFTNGKEVLNDFYLTLCSNICCKSTLHYFVLSLKYINQMPRVYLRYKVSKKNCTKFWKIYKDKKIEIKVLCFRKASNWSWDEFRLLNFSFIGLGMFKLFYCHWSPRLVIDKIGSKFEFKTKKWQ